MKPFVDRIRRWCVCYTWWMCTSTHSSAHREEESGGERERKRKGEELAAVG